MPSVARGSIVQPVRTTDGARAILKIGGPDAETEHEHLVLRRWGGDGAVRLLSADPPHRALLLERLNSATLRSLRDVDACDVVAGLYRRLHVPAMPQLRSLASELELWTRELESLPRSAPSRAAGRAGDRARPGLSRRTSHRRAARQPPLWNRAGGRPRALARDRPDAAATVTRTTSSPRCCGTAGTM